jgi:F-type H+-transporting ATPase subunit b
MLFASTSLAISTAEGGFNPISPDGAGIALWTWLIFLVALPFIWKVVMGPVARALGERDARASQAIEEAKKANEAAAQAKAEVEAKLAQARTEASKLLAEARDRAAAREREIVDTAKGEATAMVDAARRAIQAEQQKALAAIRDEVVELSLSGAKAVLQRNVGGEDDRRMVAEMVGKMKAARP